MAKYIMALDAGTTSNRCILFNEKGEMCSVAQKEFTQYFPKPGWVEHDANEIWSTQLEVAQRAMANIGATAADIKAIGITNQRETTIVWDKNTGEPVHHAIVWQCRRTSEYCDSLKEKGLVDTFRAKTGLVIDAYFSGTKLRCFHYRSGNSSHVLCQHKHGKGRKNSRKPDRPFCVQNIQPFRDKVIGHQRYLIGHQH